MCTKGIGNTQVSAFITQHVFNWMGRCASAMEVTKVPSSILQSKTHSFWNYYIWSWVFGVHYFIFSNDAVVTVECLFATVNWGGIVSRIHEIFRMIYGSLQTKLVWTKRNGRIHSYGTRICIVIYIFKPISKIVKYLGSWKYGSIWKQPFCNFCCIPWSVNSCNEALSVGVLFPLLSMVSCQKGPTRHAYAWQIGPFWQGTLVV